ncbi:LSAMP.2 family protein [Megaselia abdita]
MVLWKIERLLSKTWIISVILILQIIMCQQGFCEITADPKFSAPIANHTVPVGREAFLTCNVQELGSYKVAWLRVDTQTILTIQNHVITKNQRVGITYAERKTWQLKIKDIKESDRGWYMCQINTDPMKSQMGYLDVVVPPDILDYPTSTDMVVREGSNVTLKCAATGSPEPTITWRRENQELIELPNGTFVGTVEGSNLVIPRVKRQHMGAYLCIASNGVPPSVSKRVTLIVHFPPMIAVQNQLIGAVEGRSVVLECQSEAYPKSINYWTRERGEIVPPGGKYNSNTTEEGDYRVSMKLYINPLSHLEFGSYRCVAKNSLGDTDGAIKLYKLPPNAVNHLEPTDIRHRNHNKERKRGKATKHHNHQHSAAKGGSSIDSEIYMENDDVYDSSAKSALMMHATISTLLSIAALLIL